METISLRSKKRYNNEMKVSQVTADAVVAVDEASSQNISAIYDRHVDTVYRVCFSLMGNKQDTEDAVHSVFVKLIEREQTFTDAEHEKAWLITAARNHCRDQYRKWWRKKGKMTDLNIHLVGQTDIDGHSNYDLEKGLRKLSRTSRLMIYLHYYEGYKIREISQMLKMNLNTVKTRMRKAREHLKINIGDDFGES